MRRRGIVLNHQQTVENTRQLCRDYWTELKEARLEQYIGKQYFLCEYQVRLTHDSIIRTTTPNSTGFTSRRITKKPWNSCAQVFENM